MKRLKIKDRNSPYWTPARLAYHSSKIGNKKSKPLNAADISQNCADCPAPRPENRSQPTFTAIECAAMAAIGVLVYAWFVSDWLASL